MDQSLKSVKIERGPLAEKVATVLRESITEGRLMPGDRLPEVWLSGQLEVSRAPIREALRILELEGLVEIVPQKGARVRGLTAKDLDNIYELRSTLDSLAIRLATEHLEKDDLSYLEKLLGRMKGCVRRDDSAAYKKLNAEFHQFFYQRSQNDWLCGVNGSLMKHIMRLRSFSFSKPERLRQSYRDHVKMVELVRRKKNTDAEQVAKKHTREAGKFVLQLFMEKEKME